MRGRSRIAAMDFPRPPPPLLREGAYICGAQARSAGWIDTRNSIGYDYMGGPDGPDM